MSKISGKFAPLTEELGNDPRFLSELTDFQKLMFILIIYTCHMTHHKAPVNPNYYKKRYNIGSPNSAIVKAIEKIMELYPKLRISLGGGKEPLRLGLEAGKDSVRSRLERSKVFISMQNSKTYKNEIRLEEEVEEEVDIYSSTNEIQVVEKPEPQKRFSPPSLEEVVSFFATMGRVDGPVFFDHFTSNGWKVGGKTPMKDWHAAARNWDRRSPVRKDEPVTRRATKLQGIPSNPNRIGLAEICPTNSQTSLVNQ